MDSSVSSLTVSAAARTLPDDVPTLKAMLEAEHLRNQQLLEQVRNSVPMILTVQPPIVGPPVPKQSLWTQACSSDSVTCDAWRDTWLNHIRINVSEHMADERMVDTEYGKYKYRPAICCASGPSLKKNMHYLKDVPDEIPIISCLHNFGAFVDKGLPCKYFLTLDAGDITIAEMGEGGTKPLSYYQDASKDYTLIAALVANPELLRKWKGEIKFFTATIPDKSYMDTLPKLTKNRWVYSVGGNTFGACMYHAAWIWGCNPLALIGADFAFDYMHKFHAWDSQYDKKFSGVTPCVDIYGNRVYSWPSYQNFRVWVEYQALGGNSDHNVQIINCTEGGTLGAYQDGNIYQIKQMTLERFIDGYCRWQRLAKGMTEHEYVAMW